MHNVIDVSLYSVWEKGVPSVLLEFTLIDSYKFTIRHTYINIYDTHENQASPVTLDTINLTDLL